jgi:hypothetical protein
MRDCRHALAAALALVTATAVLDRNPVQTIVLRPDHFSM